MGQVIVRCLTARVAHVGCPFIIMETLMYRLSSTLKCERDDEKIRDGEEGAGIEVLSQCGSRADEETA